MKALNKKMIIIIMLSACIFINYSVVSASLSGDIDGDATVSIRDTILALYAASGTDLPPSFFDKYADSNNDGRIGLIEAVYTMEKVKGLRSDRSERSVTKITVGNSAVTKDQTAMIPITVDDATGIAGAAFTLTYDTTALTVTVTSAFFDTFEKQGATIGGSSTIVNQISYTQPLVCNTVPGLGMKIAAARAKAATDNSINTLFTLNVQLNPGKAVGDYPISIIATTLNNTTAGYSAAGEQTNLLIGADPTKPSTNPAAYPVLVSSGEVAAKVINGKVTFTAINKAIIVAGGGNYPTNVLWEAIKKNADLAYTALVFQGYTPENINYLSADTNFTCPADGFASTENFRNAILTWASDANDLLIYMVGHGGNGTFLANEREILGASELDGWLDNLQQTIPGNVIVVYDTCASGSFIGYLSPPTGKKRIIVTSTSAEELAAFLSEGEMSFSWFFWSQIYSGMKFYEAFANSKNTISLVTNQNQNAQIDANGNGIPNEAEDIELARNIRIGNEIARARRDETDGVIISGYIRDSSGNPGIGVTLTFSNNGGTTITDSSGFYTKTVNFCWSGTVTPSKGSYTFTPASRPYSNLSSDMLTQNYTFVAPDKAIIVAGGGNYSTNEIWNDTKINADHAYNALRSQEYSPENIHYLSADKNFTSPAKGFASVENFRNAILTWAQDASSLVIYMVDHGGDKTFMMNETEILQVSELDGWLDSIQQIIPGEVILIYDACESGSLIGHLNPPGGKKRTVAVSSAADEPAVFASEGTFSFSWNFWSQIYAGFSFYKAFLNAQNTMELSRSQHSLIDADGNGVPGEKADSEIAANIILGKEIGSGAAFPLIGSVTVSPQTLTTGTSATIYAGDVIDADGIRKVWAAITPPKNTVCYSADIPVTSLPTTELLPVVPGSSRYQATYNGFTAKGTYRIAVFATDNKDFTSIPDLQKHVVYVTQTQDFSLPVKKGDISGDNQVNLSDVISALQILSGLKPPQFWCDYASSGVDVNGDNKIGLQEAIYILQVAAGLR